MDNNGQMPPVQPMQVTTSSSINVPVIKQVGVDTGEKKDNSGLIKTIVIIVVSLIAVTFIGLFIWIFMQYSEINEDMDGQINVKVAEEKEKMTEEFQKKFEEEEKNPYRSFAGPADYGELSFKYPKTWSVYIAADAVNGGDFEAYLNPLQVDPVGKDTINALRVTITNKSFDTVVAGYQRDVEKKDSGLTVESVMIGEGDSITANRYSGNIPGTELNGYIVIFKIRDKTVILQTDSVLFEGDFNTLLSTIKFNA